MKDSWKKIQAFFNLEADPELVSYRRLLRYSLVLGLLFGLSFIITLLFMLRGPEEAQLPNFENKSVLAVLEWSEQHQVTVSTTRKNHSFIPRFHIIEQVPAAGTFIRAGRQLRLTISLGSPLEKMPNFISNTVTQARSELLTLFAELKTPPQIVQLERFSFQMPRGRIIAQTPKAGAAIDPVRGIAFLVSRGRVKEQFLVEDYFLSSYATVAATLTELGLNVNARYFPTTQEENYGKIFKQSKAPGTVLLPGDEVIFTVAVKKTALPQPSAKLPTLPQLRLYRLQVPAATQVQKKKIASEQLLRNTNFSIEEIEAALQSEAPSLLSQADSSAQKEVQFAFFVSDALGKREVFSQRVLVGQSLEIPYQIRGRAAVEVYLNEILYDRFTLNNE